MKIILQVLLCALLFASCASKHNNLEEAICGTMELNQKPTVFAGSTGAEQKKVWIPIVVTTPDDKKVFFLIKTNVFDSLTRIGKSSINVCGLKKALDVGDGTIFNHDAESLPVVTSLSD